MSRTAPPLEPSEDEDMQAQAQAYVAKVANDTVTVCQDLTEFFDQMPSHWRADDLLDMEEINYELTQILNKARRKLG